MVDIRSVTPTFAVAPQLPPEAMAEAAALGFNLVINNRPDGEEADQPSDQAMGAAAAAAGLGYLYVPVRGGPTPEQVKAVKAAIDKAEGPVLAFCRSGTRSIITWSLGQAGAGADRGSLVAMAADAGYDLSSVLA
jgi:uncharacterized protein (TIGR01244 family)